MDADGRQRFSAWAARREAWLVLNRVGLAHVLDDSEGGMSNSGPHQGLDLAAPPDDPAAPKMEAGQRTAALILMRLRALHMRAEHRLAEGDDVEAVHSELSTGIERLIRAERRKIVAEAWKAARAAVAAERGPTGFTSGPM